MFDGEGHVSITYTQKRTGKDPKLSVKLTNTHLPVLLKIKEMYSGSIYKVPKQIESYLQCYVLSFSVEQSKIFLKDIYPYLIIKEEQARLALAFSSTVYRRGRKIVTEEENKIREECMELVKNSKVRQWENASQPEEILSNFESQWIQHRKTIVGENYVRQE